MNPGYSSTSGVTIAMTRFNVVDYDSDTETVAFGSGLIWDDVYKALDLYDVNVVGGRVSGIGVSGYTLGGGSVTLLHSQNGILTLHRLLLADKPTRPDTRHSASLRIGFAKWHCHQRH